MSYFDRRKRKKIKMKNGEDKNKEDKFHQLSILRQPNLQLDRYLHMIIREVFLLGYIRGLKQKEITFCSIMECN